LQVLEEGQAKVIELTVPPGFRPTPLRDIDIPDEAIIGSIVRGSEVIVPRGEDCIESGDRLLICATGVSAEEIRSLFITSG
jgi:trk system potassium uptake protein TrkA